MTKTTRAATTRTKTTTRTNTSNEDDEDDDDDEDDEDHNDDDDDIRVIWMIFGKCSRALKGTDSQLETNTDTYSNFDSPPFVENS